MKFDIYRDNIMNLYGIKYWTNPKNQFGVKIRGHSALPRLRSAVRSAAVAKIHLQMKQPIFLADF